MRCWPLFVLALAALSGLCACEDIAGVRNLRRLPDDATGGASGAAGSGATAGTLATAGMAGAAPCSPMAPANDCDGELCSLASKPADPFERGIAVRGDTIVWARDSGLSIQTGSAARIDVPLPLGSGSNIGPASVVIDDSGQIFWSNWASPCMGTVDLAGENPQILAATSCSGGTPGGTSPEQSMAGPLLVDQTRLYAILRAATQNGTPSGHVVAVDKSTGSTELISDLEPDPGGLAIDDNYVYWGAGTAPGKIRRRAKSGLGAIEDIAGCAGHPVGLTLAGGYVYAMTFDHGLCRQKLDAPTQPTEGLTPKQAASALGLLASDESYLYWGTYNSVLRVAYSDPSTSELLYTDTDPIMSIAVGCSSVYWMTQTTLRQLALR